jgi:hypothetical protein
MYSVCAHPTQIFLRSKFSYLLFCDLTHQTGIANRYGITTYSSSKPSGRIIMIGQWEIVMSCQILFITLFFCRCTAVQLFCSAAPYQLQQTVKKLLFTHNHFVELNQHVLTFLHPILLCTITESTRRRYSLTLTLGPGGFSVHKIVQP